MKCGEKIAELRKKNGMTQDDLGKKMSVSYQAVSKWERDESQPDFETMSKIAKLFNVPLSYFEEGGELNVEREETKAETKTDVAENEEAKEEPKEEPAEAEKRMIGTCTQCGHVVYEGDEVSDEPKLVCKKCAERIRQEELLQKQREEAEPAVEEKHLIGTCTQCGHLVFEGDEVSGSPRLICKTCAERIRQEALLRQQREEEVRRKTEEYEQTKLRWKREELTRKRNRGLWIAAIPAGLFLIMSTVYSFLPENEFGFVYAFFSGLLATLLIYCFTTQMIWGGIVRNVFLCGGYCIKLPGIIFSFSPEGLFFLIVAKIFLGLVAAFVFVGTFMLCALAAVLISLFTFIPAVISRNREIAKVK